MDATPEGTGRATRRISRKWLLLGLIFAGYLAFRLVQASFWLIHHV